MRTTILMGLLIVAARPALAQERFECALTIEESSTLGGECTNGSGESFGITLRRLATFDRYPWQGAIAVGENGEEAAIDLVPPEHVEDSRGVIRTPFGWFFLSGFDESESALTLSFSSGDEVPPLWVDLQIVERAKEILKSERVWDRSDDRVCEATDRAWSLYCAMHRATIDITGEFHHRQPALQVVRRVVREVGSERIDNHRLMDFNNHPDTTLEEIHEVFEVAALRIEKGLP